jgi:hypothetical protein
LYLDYNDDDDNNDDDNDDDKNVTLYEFFFNLFFLLLIFARGTGEPFHKMITWQDLRASEDVDVWNHSFTMSALNKGAKFAHFFTRRKRHLAASVLRFMTAQVRLSETAEHV